MSPLAQLRTLFEPILTELAPDKGKVPDYLATVRQAQNPEHGDYQANFAMPLAKALGKKPPDVAKEIIAKLPANDMLETPQVAGPGFINLRLKNDWIAAQVRNMAADERLGVPLAAKRKRFVIDYSSPNVAKPLHVGHLRSTIIGDALTRLLRFLGHTVITDNHLGDWGTQFGMLIYGYRTFVDKDSYKKNPLRELARLYVLVRRVDETIDILSRGYHEYRDDAAFRSDPITELTRVFVNGVKRSRIDDEDDEEDRKKPVPNPIKTAYRDETAKLHAGDAENYQLWNEFMPHCKSDLHKVYARLGVVGFDYEHGESFYHNMLPGVVDEMLRRGIASESDGAIVIPNAAGRIPRSKEELEKDDPPGLLRKRDGAFTYTTSDLATIKYRVDHFRPDVMLYVVDFRQALHFKTFFAQARRWDYDKIEMAHISFGSVLAKDGKPLKTREGGATELSALLDRAVELGGHLFELTYWKRSAQGHDAPKWEEYTDEEKQQIAGAVGIGAVKYADLSQNRTSDYIFDFDKMLATNGNTATYMQYAYARCRSILRKSQVDESRFRQTPPTVRITHPAERALGLQLVRFEETLTAAAAEYLPHYITGYLWDLAKAFSGFFENCPVLTAETADLRDSRLLLVDLTGRVIRQALDLLGIRTVERM